MTLALVAFALGVRLAYVRNGKVIYDEYEHMHGAYLVSQGQTAFVDFFEHHAPLFYYVAAAVVPMASPSFDTMIYGRYLSLSVHLLTIVLAVLWVRTVATRAEAWVVATLLAGNFCFFAWGTRTYLDTYAAPLLVLSAWTLPTKPHLRLRCFISGLSLGLAGLVTQKAIVALFAPAAVFLWRGMSEFRDPAQRRAWTRDLATYAVGGLASALLLPALLGVDGLKGFLDDAIILNLRWKGRHFPWREIKVLFATDAFVYLTALIGLCIGFWDALSRRVLDDRDPAHLFLAALGVGAFLIPVVWEEYFILLLPFAVIVAAMPLVRWWRGYLATSRARPVGWGAAVVCLGIAASAVDLAGLRLLAVNELSLSAFLLVPTLWLILAGLIVQVRRHGYSLEPPLWVALILVLPVVQQVDWIPRHQNSGDRARLDYVMATTKPTDAVFDGNSGLGVFRPDAYKYWFLHDEMQMMLTDQEKGPDIVRALEERQPPIAIVDDFTKMLPAVVLDYLAAHYVDTRFPEIKRRSAAEQEQL